MEGRLEACWELSSRIPWRVKAKRRSKRRGCHLPAQWPHSGTLGNWLQRVRGTIYPLPPSTPPHHMLLARPRPSSRHWRRRRRRRKHDQNDKQAQRRNTLAYFYNPAVTTIVRLLGLSDVCVRVWWWVGIPWNKEQIWSWINLNHLAETSRWSKIESINPVKLVASSRSKV